MLRTILAAAIGLAVAAPAFAETSVSLEVLRKFEIVDDLGNQKVYYEDVAAAVPGEKLVYRITLRNTDDAPATSVGMALPIDANVLVDPASIDFDIPAVTKFSVDAGETFGNYADLTIEEDGEIRPAQPSDLTHMQIGIAELPAQSVTFVEYSATVE